MTHVPELAVYGLPILMAMSAGIAFGAPGATANRWPSNTVVIFPFLVPVAE